MTDSICDENLILPNVNETKTYICDIDNLKSIIHSDNVCNIMAINICSVQKHFDEFCILLDNSPIKYDIIILVEMVR